MSAAPTTGNPPERRWNWGRSILVAFIVAYVVLPWHFGVFFGHRVQCIFFPRDWILHAFALFGYIIFGAFIVINRRQTEIFHRASMVFATWVAAFVVLGLMVLQYATECM